MRRGHPAHLARTKCSALSDAQQTIIVRAIADECKSEVLISLLGRFWIIQLFTLLRLRSFNRPKTKRNALKALLGQSRVKPKLSPIRPAIKAVDYDLTLHQDPFAEAKIFILVERMQEKLAAERLWWLPIAKGTKDDEFPTMTHADWVEEMAEGLGKPKVDLFPMLANIEQRPHPANEDYAGLVQEREEGLMRPQSDHSRRFANIEQHPNPAEEESRPDVQRLAYQMDDLEI